MIRTVPASAARPHCVKHPERLAVSLRVSKLPAGKLPAQTVYRRECAECSTRKAKAGEKVTKL